MAQVVRFETVAKRLNVPVDQVVEWSKQDGFPFAGDGVADPDKVLEWQKSLAAPAVVETELPASVVADPVPAAEIEGDILWVTIRVPVKLASSGLVGSNPYHSLRINHHETHIRKTMGQVHHGCMFTHQQMISGGHVDKVSQSMKWLFEQISIAAAKALGSKATS